VLDNIRFVNRLSYLIWVVSIAILLFSGVYYMVQNWFPIKRITIDGDAPHITKEQLSYIASHRLIGTFFTINIDELQHEFHKIPWVSQVSVLRNFPDSITVKILEYKAVARWGQDDLLSADGRIFNGAESKTDLPVFYASQSQIKDVLMVYDTLDELFKIHELKIQKIIYNGVGLVKLYLSNNLELVLCGINSGNDIGSGLGSGFTGDVQVFNKYWDQLHEIKPKMTYVNMCYKNALAIK